MHDVLQVYLSPSFTKPFRDDPLFVACAFPPKATMRAVRTALFPPVTQAQCVHIKKYLDTVKKQQDKQEHKTDTKERSIFQKED